MKSMTPDEYRKRYKRCAQCKHLELRMKKFDLVNGDYYCNVKNIKIDDPEKRLFFCRVYEAKEFKE